MSAVVFDTEPPFATSVGNSTTSTGGPQSTETLRWLFAAVIVSGLATAAPPTELPLAVVVGSGVASDGIDERRGADNVQHVARVRRATSRGSGTPRARRRPTRSCAGRSSSS